MWTSVVDAYQKQCPDAVHDSLYDPRFRAIRATYYMAVKDMLELINEIGELSEDEMLVTLKRMIEEVHSWSTAASVVTRADNVELH